jgi:hypothetical protein
MVELTGKQYLTRTIHHLHGTVLNSCTVSIPHEAAVLNRFAAFIVCFQQPARFAIKLFPCGTDSAANS